MIKKYNVYGIVQGVGFRYFVYQLAIKMGFYGSVKNLGDGSVELIISSENHEKILEKIKNGNLFSRVDGIIDLGEVEGNYDDFKIIY